VIRTMKKRLILPYILLVLIAGFLLSCDKRGEEKPTLQLYPSKYELYGESSDNELNLVSITFMLDGNPSFISNAKVLVEYDGSKGLFFVPEGSGATGGANYIVLNKDGVGIGKFQANKNAFGILEFTAKMERFQKSQDTAVFYLYDIPTIEEFSASKTTIAPNETIDVFVELKDKAGNRKDQPVRFSADKGMFEEDIVKTDSNGVAVNKYVVQSGEGTATLRASLGLTEKVYKEITLTIKKP